MTDNMHQHSYDGEYQSAIARAKKVLIAAGFAWSKTTGRYYPYASEQKTTDGVTVKRIGVSETIAIHVVLRGERGLGLIEALAIAALREAGMPFDDRGWLACGADAKRAGGAR